MPGLAAAQDEGVHNSALYAFKVVTVVDGLVNPWSMAWLPNGDMLVTERPGRLRIVRGGKLLPDAVPGVPAVRVVGQGGLQDVVVHPSFAQNKLVYLSFAKPNDDGSQGTTTVVRGRFENDKLNDVEQIFEAAPYAPTPGHYGARMVFDGKGHLFLSSGDRMAPPAGDIEHHAAQDLSHHHGKILRLNEDGSVPSDNPFVGKPNVRPEIWSYGHRNPQGLALDPATDNLWETEHGPQGGDEINLIRPSLNFGWPVITYGMNYGSARPSAPRARRHGAARSVLGAVARAVGPHHLHRRQVPAVEGQRVRRRLVAAVPAAVARVVRRGRQHVANREALLSTEMRIRDVRQGPDGYIYLATDNQLGNPTPIVRLEPVSENPRPAQTPAPTAPPARASHTPERSPKTSAPASSLLQPLSRERRRAALRTGRFVDRAGRFVGRVSGGGEPASGSSRGRCKYIPVSSRARPCARAPRDNPSAGSPPPETLRCLRAAVAHARRAAHARIRRPQRDAVRCGATRCDAGSRCWSASSRTPLPETVPAIRDVRAPSPRDGLPACLGSGVRRSCSSNARRAQRY